MSREYLTIGPTPCDEVCHPANGDRKMQRIEMNAFKEQLTRVMNTEFGENLCVYFSIKSFPHDFGSYSEVCVIYDDEDQTQVQQAFWIESNTPENWDAEAEKYLKDNEYIPWNVPPGHKSDGEIVDDMVEEHHLVQYGEPGLSKSYIEVMAREDEAEHLSSNSEDNDQLYCESCHVLGHGPNNCPSRLWINQPQGKQIEDEPKQHLLPGEVLRLVLPTGHKLEVEHTADTFTITVDDDVIFDAEILRSGWEITLPKHMCTLPIQESEDTRHLVWLICKDTHNPLRRDYFVDEDIWGPNYLAIRYELGNERLILERINHFNSYNNDSNVTYTVEKVDANLFPDHITSKNGAPPFAD